MAGLAATIGAASHHNDTGAPGVLAVADALAPRGEATGIWQVDDLQLVVRAGMPAVYQAGGLALVLDGNAAPSALTAGYARDGAAAVLAGPDPYAVILADPNRHTLLLARHGDGPPLYWTRRGEAVLAASEPAALLAAGGPVAPEAAVVDRFLATGACDGSAATFFAGIRRVLPGQVVELTRTTQPPRLAVQLHDGPDRGRAVPPVLLAGRVGVRLRHGEAGFAALEAALAAPGAARPLPVFSAAFPELAALAGGGGQGAAPGLGRLARSATVRHRALPFFADEIDLDAYLVDLGEPTPYLDDWLLWAITRRVAGEVDVLVDAGGGDHRSRLADRIATRFGVALVRPERPPAGPAQPPALVADLLRRMRAELATTLVHPRHQGGRGRGLAALLGLLSGERVDPAAVWRRYVLERWLRCVVDPAGRVDPVVLGGGEVPVATPTAPALATTVGGATWDRLPVQTELLAAGDKIPEKIAWYVGEAYASRGRPVPAPAPAPARRWYVLLAAKPVAVMQGRARHLWEIRPGLVARLLARPAGRRAGIAAPWMMQVAIDELGWRRAVAATTGAPGRSGPDRWLAGPAGWVSWSPREDALPPGQVAVIPAPAEPDRVAAEVVACLRTALPDAAYASLGGCAVVAGWPWPAARPATRPAARDTAPGHLLLGWAAGPGAGGPGAGGPGAGGSDAVGPPAGLLVALCDGDPFGDNHTPIVLAFPAAHPA